MKLRQLLFTASILVLPIADSRADLLINIFENVTDGSTIVELSGSLTTDTDEGNTDESASSYAQLGFDSFGGGNVINFAEYPDLPNPTPYSSLTLPQTSGDFGGFDVGDDSGFPYTEDPISISPTFSPGYNGVYLYIFAESGDPFTIFDFQLYGSNAPGTAFFNFERIYFGDLPWMDVRAGDTSEWGSYGGSPGDGVQINTLAAPPTYPVASGPPTLPDPVSQPDLRIGKSFKKIRGNNHYAPRKPSKRQTVNERGQIFVNNLSKACLDLQNDGNSTDKIDLRIRIAREGGTTAKVFETGGGGRKVVTAQALRGNYQATLAPQESQRLIFRLSTDRFFAGLFPGRDNAIEFRVSSGGNSDFGELNIRYR